MGNFWYKLYVAIDDERVKFVKNLFFWKLGCSLNSNFEIGILIKLLHSALQIYNEMVSIFEYLLVKTTKVSLLWIYLNSGVKTVVYTLGDIQQDVMLANLSFTPCLLSLCIKYPRFAPEYLTLLTGCFNIVSIFYVIARWDAVHYLNLCLVQTQKFKQMKTDSITRLKCGGQDNTKSTHIYINIGCFENVKNRA